MKSPVLQAYNFMVCQYIRNKLYRKGMVIIPCPYSLIADKAVYYEVYCKAEYQRDADKWADFKRMLKTAVSTI